jgi:hypothetical protein
MVGGAVGFAGHQSICDDVTITGYSLVTHSITRPGVYSSLIPTGGEQAPGAGSSRALNASTHGPRASRRWNERQTLEAKLRGAKMMSDSIQLDILKILERLPHRYPFLLVDRVLECRPGKASAR